MAIPINTIRIDYKSGFKNLISLAKIDENPSGSVLFTICESDSINITFNSVFYSCYLQIINQDGSSKYNGLTQLMPDKVYHFESNNNNIAVGKFKIIIEDKLGNVYRYFYKVLPLQALDESRLDNIIEYVSYFSRNYVFDITKTNSSTDSNNITPPQFSFINIINDNYQKALINLNIIKNNPPW